MTACYVANNLSFSVCWTPAQTQRSCNNHIDWKLTLRGSLVAWEHSDPMHNASLVLSQMNLKYTGVVKNKKQTQGVLRLKQLEITVGETALKAHAEAPKTSQVLVKYRNYDYYHL